MKRFLSLGGILMIILILSACSAPEQSPSDEPQKPPAAEEVVDPLTEARQKLFDELGIQEKDATIKKEAPLPPVLPSPPTLPKTDADWPAGSGN